MEKPLHSWRVLLLPFIEQGELYKQFKLDEPWDSPHNIALLPRMPSTYLAPWDYAGKVGPYETVVHVFVGPGAAFEGKEGLRLREDFPDGLGNTIMVVEGGKAVPWTKPEEIIYAADEALPELCTIFQDGFRVLMADASGRWIARETSEAALRAAGVASFWVPCFRGPLAVTIYCRGTAKACEARRSCRYAMRERTA